MLARAVLPCVPALLGDQFCRMPPIHPEPLARVSSLRQPELGRMPDLHPGVLQGMPRTEDSPASEGCVCCLLVISDMPVGEQRVLGAVLGVQIPVGRQMLLRYPLVVLDVPTLDFCMLGCVLAPGCRGGRRVRPVLLRHMITSPHGTASARTLLFAVEDQEDAVPQRLRCFWTERTSTLHDPRVRLDPVDCPRAPSGIAAECDRKGWVLNRVYEDVASGKDANRPELAAAFAELAEAI
jgi:hypothetical protein